MSQYFHVTDGTIDDGPCELPVSWRNVSGLDLLDDTALKALGWLPQEVVGFTPFDPDTQDRTAPVNDIQSDKVVSTYTVTDKSLADAKAAWKAKLRAIFDAYGRALVSDYAPTERESWPEQVIAAQAYEANSEGDHSYLESMLKEDETASDLATLILANRALYLAASGALIQVRREHEAAIDACETASAVRAVDLTEGWTS